MWNGVGVAQSGGMHRFPCSSIAVRHVDGEKCYPLSYALFCFATGNSKTCRCHFWLFCNLAECSTLSISILGDFSLVRFGSYLVSSSYQFHERQNCTEFLKLCKMCELLRL